MRAKGITYDTGFVRDGANSRPRFDPDLVERELRIIRDDLHCTAVRVTGGDPDRIELAATLAADAGPGGLVLAVPAGDDHQRDAGAVRRLRRTGGAAPAAAAEVVFVTGAELSLMNPASCPATPSISGSQLLTRAGSAAAR